MLLFSQIRTSCYSLIAIFHIALLSILAVGMPKYVPQITPFPNEDTCPHLIHGSLGPLKSSSQTAPRLDKVCTCMHMKNDGALLGWRVLFLRSVNTIKLLSSQAACQFVFIIDLLEPIVNYLFSVK